MIIRLIVYSFLIIPSLYLYYPRSTYIDPDFRATLAKFSELSQISLEDKHLTVEYGWAKFANDDAVAYCMPFESMFSHKIIHRKIIVDKEWYNRLNLKQKELLLFHESEHCLLDKEHDNRFRSDGCPVSNMFYATAPDICVERHYDEYINEVRKK